MENLHDVLIVSVIFFSFLAFVKILVDHSVRSKLIQKDMVDEKVKFLYFNSHDYRAPSSLKWGLVLIGIGLAFVIGTLVPERLEGEIIVGCIFLFAGIAFMSYYFIAKSIIQKEDEAKANKK